MLQQSWSCQSRYTLRPKHHALCDKGVAQRAPARPQANIVLVLAGHMRDQSRSSSTIQSPTYPLDFPNLDLLVRLRLLVAHEARA